MLTTKIMALGDINKAHGNDTRPVFLISVDTGGILWGNYSAKKFFELVETENICEQKIEVKTDLFHYIQQIIQKIKNDNIARNSQYLDFSEIIEPNENNDTTMILTHIRYWQMQDGNELAEIVIENDKQYRQSNHNNTCQSEYIYQSEYHNQLEDYRQIFLAMPKPVMVFDAQGKFLFANDCAHQTIDIKLSKNVRIESIIPTLKTRTNSNNIKYATYLPVKTGGEKRFLINIENVKISRDDALVVVLDDVQHESYLRKVMQQEINMLHDMLGLIAEFSWVCDANARFIRIDVNDKKDQDKYEQLFNLTPEQWLKEGLMIGDNPFQEVFNNKIDEWAKTCILRLPDYQYTIPNYNKNQIMIFLGKKTNNDNSHAGIAITELQFKDKIDRNYNYNIRKNLPVDKKLKNKNRIVKLYNSQQNQNHNVEEKLAEIKKKTMNLHEKK